MSGPQDDSIRQPVASAALPPSDGKPRTADELLAEMKKIPLFMTDLEDMDEDNEQLQALRAISYEGTRLEQATNFKTQGNECVATKQWAPARDYYTQAIQVLRGPVQPLDPNAEIVEVDEVAEAKSERLVEEACYANRALCNLEMKNYGACQRDCAGALRLNERNIKAWYRAASACLALDKILQALDACESGLAIDPSHVALQSLQTKTTKRKEHLSNLEQVRKDRERRAAQEKATLQLALQVRNITIRRTAQQPHVEDAKIALADVLDAKSNLSFPAILLYPLHAQSDLIKAFSEGETLSQHLEYILPLPWDEEDEYTLSNIECYIETKQGGLIKAGKNLTLLKLLGSGKLEVVDQLVKINVVPKAKASIWIEEFKKRQGKQ